MPRSRTPVALALALAVLAAACGLAGSAAAAAPASSQSAAAPVAIMPSVATTTQWTLVAGSALQVTTAASGRFSAAFTDPGSATWAAEYLGDSSHLATVSPMVYVTVG